MPNTPPEPIAYTRLGQMGAPGPLVIAVPHAGRLYPPSMLEAARLPQSALETIEDRYADLLVREAVAAGAIAIVAQTARAYVDLNRDEREIDPALLAARPVPANLIASPKVSGGLGVVPSRIAAGGAVWKRPLSDTEFEQRITCVHRPYHDAVALALDEALAVHGIAILIDCHSMPPCGGRSSSPRVVVGDRHGRSAGARFVAAAMDAVRHAGLPVARNHPYAGGHTLDRHGQPRRNRHAIQIEIDRTLYLDATSTEPGEGLPDTQRLVAAIMMALKDEAGGHALAAE